MTDFAINAAIWTLAMTAIFAGLVTWTAYRVGSWRKMIDYYKKNREYSDWLPLLWIPAIIIFVLTMAMSEVNAEEVRYLDYTSIHAGLEVPGFSTDRSVFCRPDQEDSVDNRLTSNLGLTQHLVGYRQIDVTFNYTHHSCAIDRDVDVYDAFGVQLNWTLPWGQR